MQNIFKINVDLKKSVPLKTPILTEGDSVVFEVSVFDDGKVFDLSNASRCVLLTVKPDGNVTAKNGKVTGVNKVTFDLGYLETSIVGKIKSVIQVYDLEGRVSSFPFNFVVKNDPSNDYVSQSPDTPLLQTLIKDTTNLINILTQKSDYAQQQGDYAKLQGDYVKSQGDYAKDQGDYAKKQGYYALAKGDYANEKAILANQAATNANAEASNLSQLKANATIATQNANNAAATANDAANNATNQANYAKSQGDYAKAQGDYAKEQVNYAKTHGDYAKAQGDAANLAANNANDAATKAIKAANNVNTAADNANTQATNAQNAAQAANTAATNANNAASNANTKATYAQQQGDYSKAQGDYAKEQGDYAKKQGDYAKAHGNFANEKGLYAQQQGDYSKAQGDYAKQVANENKTRWLTAVNTYANIATTYPNPQLGDTVQTIDDSKIYRWDGTQWVWTQQYNANAITDVQDKIGILSTADDVLFQNYRAINLEIDKYKKLRFQQGVATITGVNSNGYFRDNEPFIQVALTGYAQINAPSYAVVIDVISSIGDYGQLIVYDKTQNGFKVKMTGSASSVTFMWTLLNPLVA